MPNIQTNQQMKVNTLFGNQAEQRKKGGREYLVIPGVPVREQVMNNYLLPAEEIQAYINVWNGTPISVGHAQANGGSVKVPEPDVPIIGNIFNVEWDSENKRMLAEYWVDIEEAMKWNEGKLILDNIHNGKMIETSTAYWADEEFTNGNFNGKDYKSIHRNTRPDHVAVFADETSGACSIEDGCGVNRNMQHNCGCVKHNMTGNLPAEGKTIWEEVYEKNKDKGEEAAAKIAWAAVKQAGYVQEDDKWVKHNNALPPFQKGHLPTAMLIRFAFDTGYRTPEQLNKVNTYVEENGITKPVWIQCHKNGDYKILDGAHRIILADEYDYEQVPVNAVDENLEPVDVETIYYKWEHDMDRSYLNASMRMDHGKPKKKKRKFMYKGKSYRFSDLVWQHGGPGSGFHGHKGREGKVGGSESGTGGSSKKIVSKSSGNDTQSILRNPKNLPELKSAVSGLGGNGDLRKSAGKALENAGYKYEASFQGAGSGQTDMYIRGKVEVLVDYKGNKTKVSMKVNR